MVKITIDGQTISCDPDSTILSAADEAGIYIPRMCYHPDLPIADDISWVEKIYQGDLVISGEKPNQKMGKDGHCNLCLVEIEKQAEPVLACATTISDGMVIQTDSDKVSKLRKAALSHILSDHPHACLTCAQKEGCSRTDCSTNVPIDERCCKLLGRCELEKVSGFIGIPGDTPKYHPEKRPVLKDEPLFDRDYNLCIGCLRCVRVCQKLHDDKILGAVWKENRAWIGTIDTAELKESLCRFCTACVEVCPTGALMDKEDVPRIRKDNPLPCVGSCPGGIDIPGYLGAIASGNNKKALEIIREAVPFPGILGYVCFHPCEDNCRRSQLDEPLSICSLKRYVADDLADDESYLPEIKTDSGKKIAILGTGPAGLTAAFYLRTLGHKVDIFEREDKPGGMLRYGIPKYRLPEEVLDRELNILKNMDIKFICGYDLGKEGGIEKLQADSYDSILLAAGTSSSKKLPIENADLDGIYPGLTFLKSARESTAPKLTGQVVVIGGGNVAIDASMTAVRLGAEAITLVCLESREEMPAHEWEIKQAEDEGIKIDPSWGPKSFLSDNSHVSGLELRRCTRVFDKNGRFDPQFDDDETTQIKANHVIVTIGQEVDRQWPDYIENLNLTGNGLVKRENDLTIGIEGLFAVGDMVKGPTSVIDAIAEGKKAAETIDKYLGGEGRPLITESAESEPKIKDAPSDKFRQVRQRAVVATVENRKSGFDLIETTMTEQVARIEASRCLRCNVRLTISPVILPPEKYLNFTQEAINTVPESEAVFQLMDAEKKVIKISGTQNLKEGLQECLDDGVEAAFFVYEEDPMYTKRESELIQQHLQQFGELPGGGDDDLDDLF